MPTLPQTLPNIGCLCPSTAKMTKQRRCFSRMQSYTGRFSASPDTCISADLTFRAVSCVYVSPPFRSIVSIDELGQVNLPYIAWVAAYNTTVLLCYLLLDLAFFPTPFSKSTYSPVSGLKVVRRPSNSDDNVSDSASTPLTMPGPSPMPAPPLLEAINRNSLAVFLLVRFISPPSPF
jgi:hypothetical protein